MKKLLYTLVLFTLVASCRTLEKMIERGQYDEAIVYATEKLAGKKKKKTKHVQMLEEAFVKVTRMDLDRIEGLKRGNNSRNWKRIYEITDKIERRQSRIDPFLPLISKDGYEGRFDFVDTHRLKDEAEAEMANYLYGKAEILLAEAKQTSSKRKARSAYALYDEADNWIADYKDTYEKKREAIDLGHVNIKVDLINSAEAVVPKNFERIIKSIDLRDMNSIWRTYHLSDNSNNEYDYIAKMEIMNISVGPEQEIINQHEDEKEIKNGYRYLKDDKGKFVRDTSGKRIKVEKFKWIHAFVTEVQRHKEAQVTGHLFFIDNNTGNTISSVPVDVRTVFKDYASTFIGDRRALCSHDHHRIDRQSRPFPHDLDMIHDASEELKIVFMKELKASPLI